MATCVGAPSGSGTALRARLRPALRTEPDPDGLSQLVHHVPGRYSRGVYVSERAGVGQTAQLVAIR